MSGESITPQDLENISAYSEIARRYRQELTENGIKISNDTKDPAIIEMYLNWKQSQIAQNISQQNTPSQASQQNTGNSAASGDLFDMFGEVLGRAMVHAMMHHDCYHACCHGAHPRLSFELPPFMADRHHHFCHHVNHRMGADAALTIDGANRLDKGLKQLNDGKSSNNVSGVLNTVVGGLETIGGITGTVANALGKGKNEPHHGHNHTSHDPHLAMLHHRRCHGRG